MFNFSYANYKEQGDVGEAAAIAYYTFKGFKVFISLQDSCSVDLIIADKELNTFKVQVKTAGSKPKGNYYVAPLRTLGGNRTGQDKVKYFDSGTVDLLFVLCENGDCYSIPTKDFSSTTELTLNSRFEPCFHMN